MKTILKPLSTKPYLKDQKKIEDFINSAEDPSKSGSFNLNNTYKKDKHLFPWEHPNIRDDLKKPFLVRLSEKDDAKLSYIATSTGKSKHFVCCDILVKAFNEILKDKL